MKSESFLQYTLAMTGAALCLYCCVESQYQRLGTLSSAQVSIYDKIRKQSYIGNGLTPCFTYKNIDVCRHKNFGKFY